MMTDAKVKAAISVLTQQRNAALDAVVALHAELEDLKEKMKEASGETPDQAADISIDKPGAE